jgi:uncharacterized protein involved in copper resistance
MKEFLQAVLISLSLVFTVGFIANGFTFSPEREMVPAMDMTDMSGMDHGTMTEDVTKAEAPTEMDHSGMDMSGMDH